MDSAPNLPPEIVTGATMNWVRQLGVILDLDTVNKIHIEDTFKRPGGNKARTAKALGIGRRTLYRLLEKYRIESAEASGERS